MASSCRIPDGIAAAFAVDYGRAGSADEIVAWGNARGMRDPYACRWELQPGAFGPDQGPPQFRADMPIGQGVSFGLAGVAVLAVVVYLMVRR